MLKQRVITAVVLLAILAGALAAPSPLPFEALMAVFVGCALWEWWRLTLGRPQDGRLRLPETAAGIVFGAALIAWRWQAGGPPEAPGWRWLWIAMSAVWVLGVAPSLARADAAAPPRSALLTLFAPVALLAAWSALAAAHGRGIAFLLTLLALVWVADIGAYFTGKAFGRRKLAPHISPGKTLEGAVGGIACAVVLVLACAAFDGTFGAALAARWGWGGAALAALLLAALSIAGDLFESLLKRRAGYKDSSALLPGHGGVYDRIDALIPVLPLAMLLV
ncbi:phosphatidate cytidylyltransferase [Pigmentiphaga soli]|uniref:Phosphatidate cytidylyltransferase n=1 Tax=Pigmentiphaga soli TaxID=1007095 RepID=A0ABP8HEL9_9BURK